MDVQNDFESFQGHIWLNAASEGPLPKISAMALREAVRWKSAPHLLDIPKFAQVPAKLKTVIAEMIGVNASDVILGNSASYGLHLLANGIPWADKDEILLMQNDFPTDILPWLYLEHQGVRVKQLRPVKHVFTPEEVRNHIGPKTRLLCLSHVHTFSGQVLQVEAIGKICQENGVLFILNLSQSAGTRPIDLSSGDIDGVVCAGYKWLLGPYGTGFSWMKPELRQKLDYNQSYWISSLNEEDLKNEGPISLKQSSSARKYDIFGTANFFNFVPLEASIQYLLNLGVAAIQQYQHHLVKIILEEIDQKKYQVISSQENSQLSSLCVFSHKEPQNNAKIFNLLKNHQIHGAFWKNNIRLSPHIYNSPDDVKRCCSVLNKV
ncbi:MAG: aminotransferase class V-fold PLP-dependent enzyme [Candidatus Omnitrophica bacterium]|nr:aminotransferase class V-fold PLP-dependent enzyme [Candidatus Omnitrophota bacterium]